jgi:transcriptional regulator with XRE-family HTH domain
MEMAVEAPAKDRRPNPVDVYVGNRIRLGRKILSVTQEKLAENLGVTFQQVQKYERGLNRISASRLHQTAQILDVPVTFFFPEVEAADPATRADAGEDGSEVMSFLSSPEGLELNRAFSQIKDTGIRRRVLDLIRSMAAARD